MVECANGYEPGQLKAKMTNFFEAARAHRNLHPAFICVRKLAAEVAVAGVVDDVFNQDTNLDFRLLCDPKSEVSFKGLMAAMGKSAALRDHLKGVLFVAVGGGQHG